jgi:hypothetical protein
VVQYFENIEAASLLAEFMQVSKPLGSAQPGEVRDRYAPEIFCARNNKAALCRKNFENILAVRLLFETENGGKST